MQSLNLIIYMVMVPYSFNLSVLFVQLLLHFLFAVFLLCEPRIIDILGYCLAANQRLVTWTSIVL